MNLAFTLAAGAAGAGVGLGTGWLNVVLERVERLRLEEDEERVEYEAEVAKIQELYLSGHKQEAAAAIPTIGSLRWMPPVEP